MWVFLPIVSLLIRATVGDPETDSIRWDVIKLENGSSDTFNDRVGKSAIDASKKWKTVEAFSAGRNTKQTDNASDELSGKENLHSIEYNGGVDSDVKMVTKRGEAVVSWLDSSLNDRGGKRINVHELIPTIRRPIRMPFRIWGGKRGIVDAQSKRTKLVYTDRDDKDEFVDRYGVNREAKTDKVGWKTSLNSWGGKRARKSSDQESDRQQLILAIESNLNDASRLPASYKDEFGEDEDYGNDVEEEPAVETKSEIRTIFDEWDGKRNDFPYRIPLHVINGTNENDYLTREEEIANLDGSDNNYDNWLTPIPNKKEGRRGLIKKTRFGPWRGKKNIKTSGLRLGNGDSAVRVNVRRVFCPWCG